MGRGVTTVLLIICNAASTAIIPLYSNIATEVALLNSTLQYARGTMGSVLYTVNIHPMSSLLD